MCKKKNQINKYVALGLLINSFIIISQRIIPIPEFFSGFCYGLAIFLIFWGICSQNHDMSKLKAIKRKLFGLKS